MLLQQDLCYLTHSIMRSPRIPECHPDRKHFCKGMCYPCFKTSDTRKAYDAKRAANYTAADRSVIRERSKKCYRDKYLSDRIPCIFNAAKGRAFHKDLDFTVSKDFLRSIYCESCPICKTVFVLDDGNRSTSPSLDRIDSSKGYIEGNVAWICSRCNTRKGDMTPTELRQIADWAEKAGCL